MIKDKSYGKFNRLSTPIQAVRAHCIECVGTPHEVKHCKGDLIYNTGEPCPLFPYRLGKGRISVKVIRQECMNCMGGSSNFVADCPSTTCNLYPFRMGKNPNYKSQFKKAA